MNPTLFDQYEKSQKGQFIPLAYRMRPRSLSEFIGQEHILAEGKPLREAIKSDQLHSFLMWGPPGCGKTSLVNIIAHHTKSHFENCHASTTGVSEFRKIVKDAEERRKFRQQSTILFVDEVHRLNKLQQDALLAPVEQGKIILIGSTTENPSFEINAPLLSRLQVYVFHPLSPENIKTILDYALTDEERGLGKYNIKLSQDAYEYIVHIGDGDVRLALNILELATRRLPADSNEQHLISKSELQEIAQKRLARHDKSAESHYNLISALIKSIRGSDPDAALYWLARLLEGGEEPRFIARRLLISASEDIGNADPQALAIASATAFAVDWVGMPEAQINLAQAVTYLASAPKSNASYSGLLKALEDVRQQPAYSVPLHLRNAPTSLMKEMGYGNNYKYAHDYEGNWVAQDYLPEQ